MKSRWTDEAKFMKVHQGELDRVLGLVGERRLELRDTAVFMALLAYSSWRSGKIRATAAKIAERLAMQEKHVISSLSRLRRELLLTKAKDPHDGSVFYLLNPCLASVGTPQTKGHMWEVFKEALQ